MIDTSVPESWSLRASVVIYIISIIAIEWNFPSTGINLGNIVAFLGALVAIFLSSNFRPLVYIPTSLVTYFILMFCFFLLCVFSVIWSVDRINTLVQTLFFLVIVLGGISVSIVNIDYLARTYVAVAVVVGLLSILIIPILPDLAYQPISSTGFAELRGIYKHQQRLGLFMAVAVGIVFIYWKSGMLLVLLGEFMYKFRFFFLPILILCLVMAQARSYTVFMILSLLAVFVVGKGFWFRFIFFVILFPIFIYSFLLILDNLATYEEFTLTGRTIIWQVVLEAANERFPEGYGFGVFDSSVLDNLWGVYRPPHAHNSFIHIFFELGVLGLLWMTIFIFYALKELVKESRSNNALSVALFVFFLTLLASSTGVTLGGKPSTLLYFMFLLLAAVIRKNSNILDSRWVISKA